MRYENVVRGEFVERPNRFVAKVLVEGRPEICHVKNTGRCRELLVPGAEVFLSPVDSPARKTKFDLVCVKKGERLINIDSQAPNKLFAEWVKSGLSPLGRPELLLPEKTFGSSRFDFYAENEGRGAFIEVKGVTLEQDGVVRFPDAPTERGVKHMLELASAVDAGFDAWAFFVIQMKGAKRLEPNKATHPQFAQAMEEAARRGVRLLALDCHVTPQELLPGELVDIRL